jgi:hypothetical protein
MVMDIFSDVFGSDVKPVKCVGSIKLVIFNFYLFSFKNTLIFYSKQMCILADAITQWDK